MTIIEVPLHIRSSDIQAFHECELRWWLNHLYEAEKPEPVYFPLGTAIHYAIEQACLYPDLEIGDAIDLAWLEYQALVSDVELMPKPTGTRSKRSEATVPDDIERMIEKWFDYVHPSGEHRLEVFERLSWPPKLVEHEIRVQTPSGVWLNTTVDAVFERDDGYATIVDWKSGATAGKAKNVQLWTYLYGLMLDGSIGTQKFPGFFVHLDWLDTDKGIQYADKYPGDEVMQRFIDQTYRRKRETFENLPLPFQDWWCKYCAVAEFCPVEGKGSWDEITLRFDDVTLVEVPDGPEA